MKLKLFAKLTGKRGMEKTTQRGEYYAVNIMKKNKRGGQLARTRNRERWIQSFGGEI
jgi:hypothetical protein